MAGGGFLTTNHWFGEKKISSEEDTELGPGLAKRGTTKKPPEP
jgi:hypothetical protein